MTYGLQVTPTDDPFVRLAGRAATDSSEIFVSGPYMVDMVPILRYLPKWFPGASFQRKAESSRELVRQVLNQPFIAAQKKVCSVLVVFVQSTTY
jgi:hypothetical protein